MLLFCGCLWFVSYVFDFWSAFTCCGISGVILLTSAHSVHMKVSKGAKIRSRYNQVPHLTQDTYGKVTNSQLYTTNESHEVSPFPAGDHKALISRRAQRHSKHKTEKTKKDPQEKYHIGTVSKIFYWRA